MEKKIDAKIKIISFTKILNFCDIFKIFSYTWYEIYLCMKKYFL